VERQSQLSQHSRLALTNFPRNFFQHKQQTAQIATTLSATQHSLKTLLRKAHVECQSQMSQHSGQALSKNFVEKKKV
jgi:hypothetical protein